MKLDFNAKHYLTGSTQTKKMLGRFAGKEINLTADRHRQTQILFSADWPNKNLMPHWQKDHREAATFCCNMMRQHSIVVRVSPRMSAVNNKNKSKLSCKSCLKIHLTIESIQF